MNYKTWSPYIFGGLAVFHFNPYTYDQQNNKVFLKPLSTEGQGLPGYEKPYSLTQLALPFGGGIKYNISDNFRIALEVGLRKLFTDYLDDVSTNYPDLNLLRPRAAYLSYRGDELKPPVPFPGEGAIRGNPKVKDNYYLLMIRVSYRLPFRTKSLNHHNQSYHSACPPVKL